MICHIHSAVVCFVLSATAVNATYIYKHKELLIQDKDVLQCILCSFKWAYGSCSSQQQEDKFCFANFRFLIVVQVTMLSYLRVFVYLLY